MNVKKSWQILALSMGLAIFSGCNERIEESSTRESLAEASVVQVETVSSSSVESKTTLEPLESIVDGKESSTEPEPEETTEAKITGEWKTAEAYILDMDENYIYVDMENPGARTFDGEGEDRKIAVDIRNVQMVLPANVGAGASVKLSYYEDGEDRTAVDIIGVEYEIERRYWYLMEISGTVQEYGDDTIVIDGEDGEQHSISCEASCIYTPFKWEMVEKGDIVRAIYIKYQERLKAPNLLCELEIIEREGNSFFEAAFEAKGPKKMFLPTIFDTDHKSYRKEDFSNASPDLLRLAKNEIYARHGYIFRDPALNEYFLTRDWYTPCYKAEEFDESCFNEYEKANLELLVSLGA